MVRIIAWGSYDESKPRVRLLLAELKKQEALHAEINIPVWQSVRDKAVAAKTTIVRRLLQLLLAYPGALIRLLRQPRHAVLLLPYPAIPDIFVAWPLARLRGDIIIFDSFISPYDTLVSDRRIIAADGFAGRLVWAIEKLALKLADIILVDTDQQIDFFTSQFGIVRDRFQTVLVGAEEAFWAARTARPQPIDDLVKSNGRPLVLFYGQLIPLHGIDTILQAIELTKNEPIDWLLIGSGQEEGKVRQFLASHSGTNVRWIPWVNYERLPAIISSATVALGIFGTSGKAARVIPNKVFQVLAVGTPLITRSSPAMEEIASVYSEILTTVVAGNASALAAAIRAAAEASNQQLSTPRPLSHLGPATGVNRLIERLG